MRYRRKIFYLDLYQEETKLQNCGYVKMESVLHKTNFQFVLKDIAHVEDQQIAVYLTSEEGSHTLGELTLKKGMVYELISVPKGYLENQILRIDILLPGQRRICYYQTPEPERQLVQKESVHQEKEEIKAQSSVALVQEQKAELTQKQDNVGKGELPELSETKWDRLKHVYPVVHIFKDDTETILIRPEDLIILTEGYHSLASNSFLLHGYYNYRQLFLAKCIIAQEVQYYICVPGTFHEREKNVAVMFGFEGFENGESGRGTHEVYQGCFGYYMKRVQI